MHDDGGEILWTPPADVLHTTPCQRTALGTPAAEAASKERLPDPSSLNFFEELAHAYTH
jgi:hypothetical protein